MFNPDWKYLKANNKASSGKVTDEDCKMAKLLYKLKNGEVIVENHLYRAYSIYSRNSQSRLLLEAMLISPDGNVDDIAVALESHVDVIKYYAEYFFDTGVFEDKLDRHDYISSIEEQTSKVTKILGTIHGMHFVLNQLTGDSFNIPTEIVYKKLQSVAYSMYHQSHGAMVTSDVAKEAKGWGRILKEVTEVIGKKEDGNSEADFATEMRFLFKHETNVESLNTIQGNIVQG